MESDAEAQKWAGNLDYLGMDQEQQFALLRHKPAIGNATVGILDGTS